jgi:hypothetical protein
MPVTRRTLARELAVNAATKPLNVVVPAAVAVAGLLLGTFWLLPVAVLTFFAMLVATFFDESEAARVGRQTYARARGPAPTRLHAWLFAPPIAEKLALARAEEARIREALEAAPRGFEGLGEEIARLMSALDDLAGRAQRIYVFLREQDVHGVNRRLERVRAIDNSDPEVRAASAQAATALEDQLAVTHELKRQLLRFDAQLEHIAASLGAIRGQIVRASVSEHSLADDDVATQVRTLQSEVAITADVLRDAYGELAQPERVS